MRDEEFVRTLAQDPNYQRNVFMADTLTAIRRSCDTRRWIHGDIDRLQGFVGFTGETIGELWRPVLSHGDVDSFEDMLHRVEHNATLATSQETGMTFADLARISAGVFDGSLQQGAAAGLAGVLRKYTIPTIAAHLDSSTIEEFVQRSVAATEWLIALFQDISSERPLNNRDGVFVTKVARSFLALLALRCTVAEMALVLSIRLIEHE